MRLANENDYRAANLSLLQFERRLQVQDLNLCWDDSELKHFCERQSLKCHSFIETQNFDSEAKLNELSRYVSKYGFSLPKTDKDNPVIAGLNRLCCKHWWFRQARKLKIQAIEAIARDIGQVSKAKGTYCSTYGLALYAEQQARNNELLESLIATNENGDSFTLKDLQALSVSNPELRRAELMTRIKGFEIVANQFGHSSGFFTVTTPSRMHATLSKGQANPKYDGTNPKEANDYLARVWSLIRSSLARQDVKVYGFRVAEPHHDGTPHWHFLLFHHQRDAKKVRTTFSHYALLEDPEESGAKKHRFKHEEIDPNKGSAAGYIAKYISKNIDGKGIEQDLYGNDARNAAQSIRAWASIWNIRQFQQVGGPSVTVWRELRRLKEPEEGKIEEARLAADASNWAAFVMAMGGPTIPAKDRPIRPALESSIVEMKEQIDFNSGEITTSYNTRYGSRPTAKVIGVNANGQLTLTRLYKWTIQRIKSGAADFAETVSEANPFGKVRPPLLDSCQ